MMAKVKRPCRVCGRWFSPHPRVGKRQKTCGDAGCKREWHRRKCAQWNKKNAEYFKAIYLKKKLEQTLKEPRICFFGLPRQEIQEEIGRKQLIIIEYIIQILLRRFQKVIKSKLVVNKRINKVKA